MGATSSSLNAEGILSHLIDTLHVTLQKHAQDRCTGIQEIKDSKTVDECLAAIGEAHQKSLAHADSLSSVEHAWSRGIRSAWRLWQHTAPQTSVFEIALASKAIDSERVYALFGDFDAFEIGLYHGEQVLSLAHAIKCDIPPL